jgi:hypothetical protein
MAAETLTTVQAGAGYPVAGPGPAGNLKVGWGTYAVAATLEDGDIFEMHWVPDGCTVVGGWYQSGDMDTGIEALDNMVGWAANNSDVADPNGLIEANTITGDVSVHIAAASTLLFYTGVLVTAGPKTFTTGGGNTMIQVENNTAPTTFAAAQLTLVTLYTAE